MAASARLSMMDSTLREHLGAAIAAAAVVLAAMFDGAFAPSAYAVGSIAVWVAVLAGLSGRALPLGKVAWPAAGAGLCLAGAMVLAAGSIGWTTDQGRAFDEAVRVSAYLGLFVLAACTSTAPARRQWALGLAAGTGIVTAIAVLSHLQPGLFDDGSLDVQIPNAAGRAAYPLGYWNALGALLALGLALLAHAGATGPSRAVRAVAAAVFPVAVLGVYLTASRGGVAAAIIGLSILIGLSADRRRTVAVVAVGVGIGLALVAIAAAMGSLTDGEVDQARRIDGDRMTAIALAFSLLAGAVAWRFDGVRVPSPPRLSRGGRVTVAVAASCAVAVGIAAADLPQRFEEFRKPPATSAVPGGESDFNSSGRWQFWDSAIDAFEEDPWRGIGAGGFEDWWGLRATIRVYVRNPHSLPLQQAAELGIPALALLAGFLAMVVTSLRGRMRGAREEDTGVLLAVLVAGGFCAAIDWTWEVPAAFGPCVLAAGLLTGSARGWVTARRGYWLGLATIAVAWLAIVAGGIVVLGELKIRQSQEAARDGRIDDAMNRAQEAHTIEPWSSAPYTQLALLEEAKGDYDAAFHRLMQAMERDPDDWRLMLIEARVQEARGNVEAARVARVRSQFFNPLAEKPVYGG